VAFALPLKKGLAHERPLYVRVDKLYHVGVCELQHCCDTLGITETCHQDWTVPLGTKGESVRQIQVLQISCLLVQEFWMTQISVALRQQHASIAKNRCKIT
jgi:hypothetical protein